ncbi:centriolar satellite-associated tubulin polyglutamylase complex regulator 1-like [Corticium candelabrum]|uniref:centriolar satellite-associated tubulin polyglutamylase complex regulator 1-like n=1 Tax=Corticium candelabrum TaxID=121492 RepID=UPI002E2771D6|nr:centriolar satellite-associated tubulin polyglutamylase complex regulator 1-like [Corticium candelabrum]
MRSQEGYATELLKSEWFLSDYFVGVQQVTQSLFREFSFVKATPQNRLSLVKLLYRCFKPIGHRGDLLNIREYYSPITPICPDFPLETIQKTAQIILTDDVMDCLVAFQFLKLCLEVYSSVLAAAIRANPESTASRVVVVPTSTISPTKPKDSKDINTTTVPENVDSLVSIGLLEEQLESRKLSCYPPMDVLRHILKYKQRVSYYEFVSLVVKSEKVNEHLGALPSSEKLFACSLSPSTFRKQSHT